MPNSMRFFLSILVLAIACLALKFNVGLKYGMSPFWIGGLAITMMGAGWLFPDTKKLPNKIGAFPEKSEFQSSDKASQSNSNVTPDQSPQKSSSARTR